MLEAAAAEAWVFDGNHHSTFTERIARADHMVFLDLPTWLRVWRVLARTARYKGKTRPDMGKGCPERFEFHFIFKWVGGYYWRQHATDLALIKSLPAHVTPVHLTSRKAVVAFLADLTQKK